MLYLPESLDLELSDFVASEDLEEVTESESEEPKCTPDLVDLLDSDESEIVESDDLRELDFESMGRGMG